MSSQNPTPLTLQHARQWVLDCALSSGEETPEDAQHRVLWEMTDAEIVRAVEVGYPGGWSVFALSVDECPEVPR